MILSEKNKIYLIAGLSFAAILVLLLLIGEIVLPFVFAIFIAYLLNPLILKIQKKIKNRNLAITSFLFVLILFFFGIIVFFGGHLVNDAKRLISAVEVFAQKNEQQIKGVKNSVLSFVDEVYESDAIKSQIESLDTLITEDKEQDLVSTIGSVYSFFEDSAADESEAQGNPWSPIYMLSYTLLYLVFILYTFGYFEAKYAEYFGSRKLVNKRLEGVWSDFDTVFIRYFKQRLKVVLINTLIVIIAFTIVDLPGAIIIGILTGVLSYASHFHYFSLPLVGIGCWVLSIEYNTSFFLYFGILLAVFILISVLEETIYFDKVMNSVNGMNPAIMLLSFTLWIYVFGGFTGTIIALPLTQLIMIYMHRLLLYSKDLQKM